MGWFSPISLRLVQSGDQLRWRPELVFKTVPPLREGGLLPSGRCEPMAGGHPRPRMMQVPSPSSNPECGGSPTQSPLLWTWVIAIRNQVVLKAVENGRIVGGAMISRRANHDGYYLDLIIVDPDHRNLGIGNALMKAALATADGSEVAAFVSTDNAASLSLLERFWIWRHSRGRGSVRGTSQLSRSLSNSLRHDYDEDYPTYAESLP